VYNIVKLAKFATKNNLTLFQLIEHWNFFDEDAPADIVQAYEAFFAEYAACVQEEKRMHEKHIKSQ
jgi:hypothetical protein